MPDKLVHTELEIKVIETAKCTCGWCGNGYQAEVVSVEEYDARRLRTTGGASADAAWEGAVHLEKISSIAANRIKRDLQRRRTYQYNDHIVKIEPETKTVTKSVKQ